MSKSRRDFLKLTGAAGGAIMLGGLPNVLGQSNPTQQTPPPAKPQSTLFDYTPPNHGKAKKPLNILFLGGTGFTGPFQVQYALSRGHKVSVFNRGRTRAGELPEGVEQLIGDRNGDYKSLVGRKWDVCIDIPTSIPVWVRDAAQVLQGNVGRYVFVSTVSVYADQKKRNQDETAPLAEYKGADAMKETRETLMASPNLELYGPLKALSEREAEKWFPGKTMIVRPGYIVGPQDGSDRFTYWPLRVERGGEMMAPGNGSDPIQIIDARDLSEWIIRAVENGTVGAFNAVGPKDQMSMDKMLKGIKDTIKSNAQITWVPTDFLAQQKVLEEMPIWAPADSAEGGVNTHSNRKAVAAGLTYRSLADTTNATLAWYKRLPAERRNAPLRAGIKPEREVEVLAAWKAKKAVDKG